jgi:hypothetical protein
VSELIERTVEVEPGGAPITLDLDLGGGIGAAWVVRRIVGGAVAEAHEGDTSGGGGRSWQWGPGALGPGSELQVMVTFMAPAVDAPWQLGLRLRQGSRALLADRGRFQGELRAAQAATRVVRVAVKKRGAA